LIIGDDSEGLIEELGRDFIYAGGWCTAFFFNTDETRLRIFLG